MKKITQLLFLMCILLSQKSIAQCPPPVFDAVGPITVVYNAVLTPSTINYDNGSSGPCALSGSVTSTFTSGSPGVCGGTVEEIWTVPNPGCGPDFMTSRTITFTPGPSPVFTNTVSNVSVDCGNSFPTAIANYSNGLTGIYEISGFVTFGTGYLQAASSIICDTTYIQTKTVNFCGTGTISTQRTIHINSYYRPPCPPYPPYPLDTIYTNCNCSVGTNGTIDYHISGDPGVMTHPCCLEGLGLQIKTDYFTNAPVVYLTGAGCGDIYNLVFCDGSFRYFEYPSPWDIDLYSTDITAGTPEQLVQQGSYAFSQFTAVGPAGHLMHLRAVRRSNGFQSTLNVTIPSAQPVQCNLTLEASGETIVGAGCDNTVNTYFANYSNEQSDCPSEITLNVCGQTYNYGFGESPTSYQVPANTSCTISGSYICKGQTCPLNPVTVSAPSQIDTCDDFYAYAYIQEQISLPCTPLGKIYVAGSNSNCLNQPIAVQFYRDSLGTHLNETIIPDLANQNGYHVFDNLPTGKYVINITQAGNGCTMQEVLYIGVPQVIMATVKNLVINTIIGKIDTIPLAGVTIEAYPNSQPSVLVETTTTDDNGNFSFILLDSAAFYKLKFKYQDADGVISNLYIDYDFTGYKHKVDTIGEILLPYSMLVQTRSLLDTIRTKGTYQIDYLISALNEILTQNRTHYDVADIDTLLNDWRTIDKINAEDVISNLGRAYIALGAHNEFEKDAYQLSKLPPKALTEIVMMVLEMVKIADKFSSFLLPEGLAAFRNNAAKGLVKVSLELVTKVLESRFETIPDGKEKQISDLWIRALKAGVLTLDKLSEPSVTNFIGAAKGILNDQLFILLHEKYVINHQDLVDDVYNKAVLLAPPDDSFELAYSKVLLDNGTSLVSTSHAETQSIIDLCENVFFSNVDKAESIFAVEDVYNNYAAITGTNDVRDLVKFFRKVSVLFDVFKATNYSAALIYSWNRYRANSKENAPVNAMTYSPGTISGMKTFNPSSNFSSQNRLSTSNGLCDSINRYNMILDSVMFLINNFNNSQAISLAPELFPLNDHIDSMINIATNKISSLASLSDSIIPGYDSIYNNMYLNDLHNTYFHRTGTDFCLTAWFLDTISIGFLDTLNNIAAKTIISNVKICQTIQFIDSITGNVSVPVRMIINDIEGINETDTGTTNIINVYYQNYGTDTAHQVYAKIDVGGGFNSNIDSIFLNQLLPGQSGNFSFIITAPPFDTSYVYTIQLFLDNGEGDYKSDYIKSNGIKNCIFYQDEDNDRYGGNEDTIIAMYYCNSPVGYVKNNLDCNDLDSLINPDASEACNGIDDDCNGIIDDYHPVIVAVNPFSPEISLYNSNTWQLESSTTLNLPGSNVTGALSVSYNPITNNYYAVVKAGSQRKLVIVNPLTGLCISKGNLGDNFASITFAPNGILYGVTGDGANVPETLYKIDTSNASKTFLATLGNGDDGEVIVFNGDDGFIYHWSGNQTPLFEKIDTSSFTVIPVSESGYIHSEIFGAMHLGGDTFNLADINYDILEQTTDGLCSLITTSTDYIRGFGIRLTAPQAPTIPVITASSFVVCDSSSSVQLNINAGMLNSASHWQWYRSGCGENPVGSGDSIIVSPDTTTTYFARGEGICISPNCGSIVITFGCGLTLNIKVFFEGYYLGSGTMQAVIDPSNYPSINDSAIVELRDTIAPFNILYSKAGLISTNGAGQFFFQNALSRPYYIVVRQRNSIETWSKHPVLFDAPVLNFDFTD